MDAVDAVDAVDVGVEQGDRLDYYSIAKEDLSRFHLLIPGWIKQFGHFLCI